MDEAIFSFFALAVLVGLVEIGRLIRGLFTDKVFQDEILNEYVRPLCFRIAVITISVFVIFLTITSY